MGDDGQMTDFISREELKSKIRAAFPSLEDRCRINEIVNSIPAADVAPVVRCRDCKKGWPAGEYVYCMKPHAGNWPTHKWDWYCADAERKEDAK